MARMKKPEKETQDQAVERRQTENIANKATRGEKTSWYRMMDNMVKLIAKLRPIEDKLLELSAQKIPILDEIAELRAKMVKECVHPFEHLVSKDGFTECKFCGTKLRNLNFEKLRTPNNE